MIFYFTGTGNSLWVAKRLGEAFDEPLVSVAAELNLKQEGDLVYSLRKDEKLFFVYPVHSWGPAVPILRFIARLKLRNYTHQPIYAVSTCGDECGYADRLLEKALTKRELSLQAVYSVTMPNNYILLPGFDVDNNEVEKEKLAQAPQRVDEIIEAIQSGKTTGLYHKGGSPWVKTYLVYPLFAHLAIGKNAFRVTDACISCGLCERVCPTQTITMQEGKPTWGNTCVQCVACIHRCPVRAIEYGKETIKKGRYHHPEIK
ncbi:MAG: EFR1 family ferrodoxin [Parabacteroides sp.]|nr:EFR1 family ferrodoxin [Parabacteroides sp.]